jgi:hypothetical protein
MSQGLLRLRYDGLEPELYEAEIDTWDNPDGGAVFEIYFSGTGADGPFTGTCKLEKAHGWTYEGAGLWNDHNSGESSDAKIHAQLSIVGKTLVLKGTWLDLGDDWEPYDLFVEIDNR